MNHVDFLIVLTTTTTGGDNEASDDKYSSGFLTSSVSKLPYIYKVLHTNEADPFDRRTTTRERPLGQNPAGIDINNPTQVNTARFPNIL